LALGSSIEAPPLYKKAASFTLPRFYSQRKGFLNPSAGTTAVLNVVTMATVRGAIKHYIHTSGA
jgi:hypothetical protein